MAIEVFIPKLGANMTEGKIESWYVDEGEEIDIGEPLFDLVTDKATVVVEAEARGIVKKILVPEDTVVPIVTTVAVIGDENEDITGFLKEIEDREKRKKEEERARKESEANIQAKNIPAIKSATQASLHVGKAGASISGLESPSYKGKLEVGSQKLESGLESPSYRGGMGKSRRIKASPKARMLAKVNDVDLSLVGPTGKDGVITFDDVERFIESGKEKKKAVIIGAGEYSRVILEIMQMSDDIEAVGFIDDNKNIHGRIFAGIPVLGGSDRLPGLQKEGINHFIVSVGVPKIRSLLFRRCLDAGLTPVNAIHPKACVSNSAVIHPGSVIEAFSVIAVNAVVERGSFVTQNCSVSHDCRLQEFCHLAPGCHLGGSVDVGRGTLIGVGASIAPHLEIGDHVIVTPGTSIDSSIPKGSVVEGVPGRIIGKTSMVF